MDSISIISLVIALAVFIVILDVRRKCGPARTEAAFLRIEQIKKDMEAGQTSLRQEVAKEVRDSVISLGNILVSGQEKADGVQREQLSQMNTALTESFLKTEGRFNTFAQSSERQMTDIRETVEKRLSEVSENYGRQMTAIRDTMEKSLAALREDNGKKLDEMRGIVDEKLQKTLNERLSSSFKQVSDLLIEVNKSMGDMQNLATGVGDLKKVLSNVKTRGILGELQLGAILEQILSPGQYEKNCQVKKGSAERVEFAVKIPSEDGSFIYLPIDSKFPGDVFGRLRDAYDSGIPEDIKQAYKLLDSAIKTEAKSIRDKYINPPETTEFAIMFLPFEGLYAEVVNRGMLETLQNEFNVNIAGPSTMAALLNSLQMGFRTFAIQKRSGEVWNLLSAVKTAFGDFNKVLVNTQNRLNQANRELDTLVGARSKKIMEKLDNISRIEEVEAKEILGIEEDGE